MEICKINPQNKWTVVNSINRWIEIHQVTDVKISLVSNSLRVETLGMAYGPLYSLSEKLRYFVEGVEMLAEIRRERKTSK